MRTRWLTLMLVAGVPVLGAQETERSRRPEIRPFVGAYIPTGAMRDNFKTATMLGAQVGVELSQNFHVLASTAWTHGHNKFNVGSDRTNIWQYDAGVEANLYRPLASGWVFRPFMGAGAGARSYDYRVEGVKTRTCTAGYGSVGSELQSGPVAIRLEARDYLTCFRSPVTGKSNTRNDVGVTFGVAYHVR